MKDYFETYHPLVNFLYFTMMILFSMFFLHPIYMIIAFSGAFIYSICLEGWKAIKFNVIYMLPSLFLIALINPLFNHEGATILFYFKNGNPFTLESVIYGFVLATLFINVIIWFSCYNKVMTSDKFMYLFGKVIPSASLVFSMALRFVPLYKERIQIISNAQKCVGNDVTQGNLVRRAKNGIKILSIMTTWSLESSIETADSMKARGYGLKGRTAFSNYVWRTKDRVALGCLSICGIWIFVSWNIGIVEVSYFPRIKFNEFNVINMISYICYFILCYFPIFINLYDQVAWRLGENESFFDEKL